MSETVALALISALPISIVAVVALVANYLQSERRLAHEEKMRRLEWRRVARLKRLAPIREYLSDVSRLNFQLSWAVSVGEGEEAKKAEGDLDTLMIKKGYVIFACPDPILTDFLQKVAQPRIDDVDDGGSRLLGRMSNAWQRLEELESDIGAPPLIPEYFSEVEYVPDVTEEPDQDARTVQPST